MAEYFTENLCKIAKEDNTFFNPAQKLNRDISIEVIKAFFPKDRKIRILGAMSATGIREIRYLQEIENCQMIFNDLSKESVETIQRNLEYNGFNEFKVVDSSDLKTYRLKDLFDNQEMKECNENRIKDSQMKDKKENRIKDSQIKEHFRNSARILIIQSDCRMLMNKYQGCFDVIDIDPFGSCATFLEDALRGIRHNGLLFLTCTDKASLCANEAKCCARYGVKIKRKYAQNEIAVRALLSFVSREAAKYDSSIVPIITLSVDFYVRVIVQVKKNNGKSFIENNSYAFICECLNNKVQGMRERCNSVCDACKNTMKIYGLFWNKAVYDNVIIERMLKNAQVDNERMIGILRLMKQEINYMFYYELPMLCSKLKVNSCKLRELMNCLANCGYKVSLVYYDNNSIKTNAPLSLINDMIKNRTKYNFENNTEVDQIFETQYFKGKIASKLKPLSLPSV